LQHPWNALTNALKFYLRTGLIFVEPKIFITHSSRDQKVSKTICHALENRGLPCWISSRDIKPGQNFQEQIVKAIRAAKIMVLVFTANSNNSNEIKKELALASQNKLIVIPVRIEDITPNEALAYEFATRQWIDMFDDWETSITRLIEQIASVVDDPPSGDRDPELSIRWPAPRWVMVSGLAVLVAAAITYGISFMPRQGVSTNHNTPTCTDPSAQFPEIESTRVSAFTYRVAGNPDPSNWTRATPDRWVEKNGDGEFFLSVEKRIHNGDCDGTVVSKGGEPNLQLLISDRNCGSPRLFFRRLNSSCAWTGLARMESVR
jgi:hypothetical protein